MEYKEPNYDELVLQIRKIVLRTKSNDYKKDVIIVDISLPSKRSIEHYRNRPKLQCL